MRRVSCVSVDIDGFAIQAYPSGQGVVLQKALGSDTEKAVQDMRFYDPDFIWMKALPEAAP